MISYTVKKPTSLFAGEVGLDDKQAERRLQVGKIKRTGVQGVYLVVQRTDLKAGEEILLPENAMASKLIFSLNQDSPAEPSGSDQDAPAEPKKTAKKPGRPRKK